MKERPKNPRPDGKEEQDPQLQPQLVEGIRCRVFVASGTGEENHFEEGLAWRRSIDAGDCGNWKTTFRVCVTLR